LIFEYFFYKWYKKHKDIKKGLQMKYIKLLIASLGVTALFAVPVFSTYGIAAAADPPNITGGLCAGANLEAGTTGNCENTSTAEESVNKIVTTIINIFSWIVGVVCVIMIIYGGFRYVTAGGDSGNVSTAKNTILYAIVGLVIVAMAQIIVKFVLAKVTNTAND
jgi:hypothetical protein